MTKTETAEWLGRELTANEDRYFDFLVPVHRQRQNDKILVAYAWAECSADFLETPIPQDALNSVYGVSVGDDGSESPNVLTKALRDFSLQITRLELADTYLVLLGAREFEVGRQEYVSADDLADWDSYLIPNGFDSSKWIGKAGYLSKIEENTNEAV